MLRPTVKIQTVWRDRDKREAQLQLYLPSSVSLAQAVSGATLLISKVAALSNAICVSYKLVWEGTNEPEEGAGIDSDVNRAGWLFYRNEDSFYEAIKVPSIRHQLVEAEGPWAGVRIVAKTTAEGAPLLVMESLAAILVTAEGEAFPGELVNGGLML